MDEKSIGLKLLEGTIGISIDILSDDFQEWAGNTHHKIIFQINEEGPDKFALGVLLALSLMSFSSLAKQPVHHAIRDSKSMTGLNACLLILII
jgi:hypothetical protein